MFPTTGGWGHSQGPVVIRKSEASQRSGRTPRTAGIRHKSHALLKYQQTKIPAELDFAVQYC
jgi:hypothetical protein